VSSQVLFQNHCLLRTNDYDEAHIFVSQAWEQHRHVLLRGRYGISWHHAPLGDNSLTFVETEAAEQVCCSGPQSDVFRFGFHESGRIEHRINGAPAVSMPGKAILHAPGQDLRLATEPFRLLFINLPGPVIRAALARRFDRIPPFETWATEAPFDMPEVSTLRSFCYWIARELDRPGSLLVASSRATASLERALVTLFVECLDRQYPFHGRRTMDLAEAQVRQMEEWIDDNLTEPIGIEDLADLVEAVPRSVQRAFRRYRGCSPTQAIMGRRFDLARRRLRAPDPATTVTGTATECGFYHLGRFSVRYRQLYGESPSATLARSRR
jgi:AraC-like DNA-binding protein